MAYFDLLEGICYFIWIYVSQPAIVGVFEVKVHVPFSKLKKPVTFQIELQIVRRINGL